MEGERREWRVRGKEWGERGKGRKGGRGERGRRYSHVTNTKWCKQTALYSFIIQSYSVYRYILQRDL